MKDTIRTFIAVKIIPGNQLKSFFGKVKNTFPDESIKWVDENNLHLTLRFLGETSSVQIKKINQSLVKISDCTENFSFKLKGVSYFKKNRMPRVLFVNIEEKGNLEKLAGLIEDEVRKAGFSSKEKIFNPHLTLGRIKFLKNIDRFFLFIKDWKENEFQTVRVNEIIYYQSILNSNGSVYKPLGKFVLK